MATSGAETAGCSAEAAAPCSMVQIGCPTLTTDPSAAMISPKVPSAGAGISALTLSLATSAIDS